MKNYNLHQLLELTGHYAPVFKRREGKKKVLLSVVLGQRGEDPAPFIYNAKHHSSKSSPAPLGLWDPGLYISRFVHSVELACNLFLF